MKKIITITLTILFLASCSAANSYSKISDGDTVLFKGPDNYTFTKENLYQNLKKSSTDAIENNILENIALKYDLDMDEIEKSAQELVDAYVNAGYENYLVSYYGSVEAYKEFYIQDLVINRLNNIYVTENFDELVKDDAPVKMQIGTFNSEDDAKKCIEDVNNGTTFDTAAVNNNSTNEPVSNVYSDSDTSLALVVKEYLNTSTDTGLSPVLTGTTNSTDAEGNSIEVPVYYVLNVESKNVEDFKDEYINLLTATVSTTDVRNYFFGKHNIDIFDQDIYKVMSEKYEVLK